MKKTTYLWIFVAVAAFLFVIGDGCDGDHDANTTEEQTSEQSHSAQHESHSAEGETGLGTSASAQKTATGKWKANPETTNGIETMMNAVGSFTRADADTHCDKMKRVLRMSFNNILQRCTMTGEAHDALHEYLMPLTEKIDRISTTDADQCFETVKDISEYLARYYDEFE
ncbi:MAG TPA: hypothetical protein ENJ88_07940 [Phaeodactylibacter sp.]|nr:hypothetical protein [Phaeodactylibacter sp.]